MNPTPFSGRRSGFTLLELCVVMAIIAVLAAMAIPSLSGLTKVSAEGAMRTSLRSLFASARARAATQQKHIGIRFQQDKDGRSYAIMLQPPDPKADASEFPNNCPGYDPNCNYLTLIAIADAEPIALPRGVEVAGGDLLAGAGTGADNLWTAETTTGCVPATTFTVLFSPAGQVVRKHVHVSQRRDRWQMDGSGNWNRIYYDPVFNLTSLGMFRPDVYDNRNPKADPGDNRHTDPGPQLESGPNQDLTPADKLAHADTAIVRMSEGSIWVYEQQKRREAAAPFTDYVSKSGAAIQLNAYTGSLVNTQQ